MEWRLWRLRRWKFFACACAAAAPTTPTANSAKQSFSTFQLLWGLSPSGVNREIRPSILVPEISCTKITGSQRCYAMVTQTTTPSFYRGDDERKFGEGIRQIRQRHKPAALTVWTHSLLWPVLRCLALRPVCKTQWAHCKLLLVQGYCVYHNIVRTISSELAHSVNGDLSKRLNSSTMRYRTA